MLSARILCLAHTLAPANAGSRGRRTWGPSCCPTPAALSKWNFHPKFHLLQVETFIPHPQWVQGQVVPVPLPSWVMFSRPLHIFFYFFFFPLLCLGGSPLDTSIPYRVMLHAQDKSPAEWFNVPMLTDPLKGRELEHGTSSQSQHPETLLFAQIWCQISRQSVSYLLENIYSSFLGPL